MIDVLPAMCGRRYGPYAEAANEFHDADGMYTSVALAYESRRGTVLPNFTVKTRAKTA